MRLIDADALKEKAWDAKTQCGYVQVIDVGDIDDAPTIELETEEEAYERGYTAGQMAGLKKTGKWIWKLDEGDPSRSMMLVCSICGGGRNEVGTYNFCHICGIKMINPRGEQDEID